MEHYPPSIINLITHFSKLPGIGQKTAERLALHILRSPKPEVTKLAQGMVEVKEKVTLCRECFGLSDTEKCRICNTPNRDASVVCVVENPGDMIAIEKSGSYNGKYHILQGVLSPMDGIGPDDIRMKELISRVAQGAIKEIVIATSTNVEGEATASYIAEKLKPFPITVTRIASGVPIGGDLKYVDQVTLGRAMEARRSF